MKNVKDFYEKTATGWSDLWLTERKNTKIAETFFSLFSQAGTLHPKILDVGCGAGYDSFLLSDLGANVVGVDFCENLIEIAKANSPKCEFYVKDITNGLDDLGLFDGIFCTAVLDYVDIMSMKHTFQNFARIMKKGALLFVSVINGNGKNERKSLCTIENEVYDLNFFEFSAQQLCTFASPEFKLVDTIRFEDFSEGWRYYVFMNV